MENKEVEKKLMSVGGRLWEKESMKRIYLNINAITEISEITYTESQLKKASKGKAYYDVKNGEFYAENGMVTRNVLRAAFDVTVNKL